MIPKFFPFSKKRRLRKTKATLSRKHYFLLFNFYRIRPRIAAILVFELQAEPSVRACLQLELAAGDFLKAVLWTVLVLAHRAVAAAKIRITDDLRARRELRFKNTVNIAYPFDFRALRRIEIASLQRVDDDLLRQRLVRQNIRP